jgi:hypothetical protein
MRAATDEGVQEREDKRRDKRLMSHAPLIFSIFGSNFQRESASMTFNHSRGGLCFEAAEPIKPGTTLCIRRGKAPVDESHDARWEHLPTSSLGEVRWCRELADKFGTYYCIGVKYY